MEDLYLFGIINHLRSHHMETETKHNMYNILGYEQMNK